MTMRNNAISRSTTKRRKWNCEYQELEYLFRVEREPSSEALGNGTRSKLSWPSRAFWWGFFWIIPELGLHYEYSLRQKKKRRARPTLWSIQIYGDSNEFAVLYRFYCIIFSFFSLSLSLWLLVRETSKSQQSLLNNSQTFIIQEPSPLNQLRFLETFVFGFRKKNQNNYPRYTYNWHKKKIKENKIK